MNNDKQCTPPPEIQKLNQRQQNIERRLRFVEARLGIVHQKAGVDIIVTEENKGNINE